MKDGYILGISAFYHDSAACLLKDGEIVAAGQEERFTRKKGDAAFPRRAVDFCLAEAGIWVKEKLFTDALLRKELGYDGPVLYAEHHESHAASAFFPSPFEEAAVLTIDGVGEWATSSIGAGRGHQLDVLRELRFPHSLGLLYSAFTYFTGFKVNSGEYKLMGLAPYGEPRYADLILERLIDLKT